MTKRTPGKWTVLRESDKGGWKGICVTAGNNVVANIVMQLTENEAANARFIAAGPDMEEALEVAAKAEMYDPATGIIDADVLEIVQQAARAALRKARGE